MGPTDENKWNPEKFTSQASPSADRAEWPWPLARTKRPQSAGRIALATRLGGGACWARMRALLASYCSCDSTPAFFSRKCSRISSRRCSTHEDRRAAIASGKFASGGKTVMLESRFDLAYNAAHARCLAALRWHGYRPADRYIVFHALPHALGTGHISSCSCFVHAMCRSGAGGLTWPPAALLRCPSAVSRPSSV